MGGSQLQLRAEVAGFDDKALADAIAYIHQAGKKAYITVNCFAKNSEIDNVGAYAKFLHSIGADAVIVSDIGVIHTIRNACPELEVHVSTQANCVNYASAMVYRSMGAKRVVLGREMSLEEIAELRAKVPLDLELEAFVHGAMCMAYSGRCLISSFLNNRSGNRGDCTQPCRWNYHLVEQTRPNVFLPVIEDERGSAILSSHDMNCLAILDQIADAGICSFKIEGRMKSPYYVATVTNAYRHAIDKTGDTDMLLRELETISHRPYADGFYFGEVKKNHNNSGAYTSSHIFVGVVKEDLGGGLYRVEERNKFNKGETIEILSPRTVGLSFTVEEIFEDDVAVDSANKPMKDYVIRCPHTLYVGDFLRKPN
ncbi:MAG: U32 family peptidase C-terminal domain-containing protein [Clostridia bacterium]|nr:U32 family peptidase C-terminal domain-containing protein [Clostridia bacterium]